MVQFVELAKSRVYFVWSLTFIVCTVYPIKGARNSGKYRAHKGWIMVDTTGQVTTTSLTGCAAYTSAHGNSVLPLLTYNKTTSSCTTIVNAPQIVYLQNTGDDKDIVFLNESNCTQYVFKVYKDIDYVGNDYLPGGSTTSIDACVNYCGLLNPDFKSLVYEDMRSSSNCWCKYVTIQEHIDMGDPVVDPCPGLDFYERLC